MIRLKTSPVVNKIEHQEKLNELIQRKKEVEHFKKQHQLYQTLGSIKVGLKFNLEGELYKIYDITPQNKVYYSNSKQNGPNQNMGMEQLKNKIESKQVTVIKPEKDNKNEITVKNQMSYSR